MDLSTRNLMQALSVRRQIDALERRLRGLVGGSGGGGAFAQRDQNRDPNLIRRVGDRHRAAQGDRLASPHVGRPDGLQQRRPR